jgi:Sulfotransferase family
MTAKPADMSSIVQSQPPTGLHRFPDIASIHEEAIALTGLSHFGDPSYREALKLLIRGYDTDPHMTTEGRLRCYQMTLGALIARLRSEAQWQSRPAVLALPLTAPIIVTGLPRTGTTTLHKLLAIDPQFQELEFWIGNAPQPRPPRETWATHPDYLATDSYVTDFYDRVPEFLAVHQMTAAEPEEDRTLLIQDFAHLLFMDSAYLPEYDSWVERQPQREAYRRMADNLRLIGSTSPERRWVLKDPMHLAHMDAVLEVFPDAKIIQTHRDPVKSIPSICSLIWIFRKYYENPDNDPVLIGPRKMAYWAAAMERTLHLRNAHPGNFLDISFGDIVADPLKAVHRVYTFCGLALDPAVEASMRDWITHNGKDKHGAHRYSPETFGLTADAIAAAFEGYTTEYGIVRESRA